MIVSAPNGASDDRCEILYDDDCEEGDPILLPEDVVFDLHGFTERIDYVAHAGEPRYHEFTEGTKIYSAAGLAEGESILIIVGGVDVTPHGIE